MHTRSEVVKPRPASLTDVTEASSRVSPSAGAAAARLDPSAATESLGHWCLATTSGDARFSFYGKATTGVERDLEAALERAGKSVAFLRQIHSARVLDGAAGACGDGDALVTRDRRLALRIVTADCVPVLLASETAIAAVHAGWRGLAAGVIGAAVERIGDATHLRAVIGPCIGACCYEVGPDVAEQVARQAGSDRVIVDGGHGNRPHLDLALATRLGLARAGVADVLTFDACTRCDASRWWSYRREGKGAGRNVALVWREG